MNLETALTDVGAWILRNSWEGSALLLIVALLLGLGRNWLAPGFRIALWSLVGMRLLLPIAPESPVSLFRHVSDLPVKVAAGAFPKDKIRRDESLPTRDLPVVSDTSAAVSGASSPLAVFSTLWLVGVVVLILHAIHSWRRLRREIERWQRVRDPHLLAMVRGAGIGKSVEVVETIGGGIGVFGFLKVSHLFLPVDLRERYSEAQIRGILRHEAEHLRRGDLLWNWIVFLVQALHWFNPLVWLAGRQLRNDLEILCDQAALRRAESDERREYGAALVRALELHRLPLGSATLLPFISRKNEVKQRLHLIMKNPRYSMITHLGMAVLAIAAVAFTLSATPPAVGADEEKPGRAAEEGKRDKPERERDGAKPKEGERDGAKPKDGEGDKGKGAAKEGDKAPVAANLNVKERRIFEAYDKDGDGKVTAEEMEAMMEGKQNSSGRRQIRKAIDRADKDGDEGLNFDEFLFWYTVGRLDEKSENR